jgi:hypothetical protein
VGIHRYNRNLFFQFSWQKKGIVMRKEEIGNDRVGQKRKKTVLEELKDWRIISKKEGSESFVQEMVKKDREVQAIEGYVVEDFGSVIDLNDT